MGSDSAFGEPFYKEDNMKSFKMYLPNTADRSREELHHLVQSQAIKLGFEWPEGKAYLNFNQAFLFFNDGLIQHCQNNYDYYKLHENQEITTEQFLALPVPEKRYRPYNDVEMDTLLYHPIIHQEETYKINVVFKSISESKKCITAETINGRLIKFDAEKLLKHCVFADGSPCGVEIKEGV